MSKCCKKGKRNRRKNKTEKPGSNEVRDHCLPCNTCISPRECKKDLHCLPPSKIKVYDNVVIVDCSAEALNAIIREINEACYDETIIYIPPGAIIRDKICLSTTRKVTICGDPCHPALFDDHIVSCGNKKLSGINLGGNGIYQLNESCGVCLDPEVFDNVHVTCNRSFVSESRAGIVFLDSFFDLRQNGDFVIRMSQGNLHLDNNKILLDPSNNARAFAYYDGGNGHTWSDNEVKVSGNGKCSSYSIHLINSCTHLDSTGNRYYANDDGGNLIIFEGDDDPFATVHSTSDHVEEQDCNAYITLMEGLPGETVFSNGAFFISKLVELGSTTGNLGCKQSTLPGITKIVNSTFKNPTQRTVPAIHIVSDFIPLVIIVPVTMYTLEVNNTSSNSNIVSSFIVAEGVESFQFTSLGSSFIDNSGAPSNQVFEGDVVGIIPAIYGSRSIGYSLSSNSGGLAIVAASSIL